MKIHLPTGGTFFAPADPTRDAPGDCSRAFSLLPLITSYLATTQCLIKVLQLVGPLVTIVKGLDRTPDIIPFLRAADQLTPCEFAGTPASMLPFIRDIVCVLIQALNCVIEQSTRVIDLLASLAARLGSARAAENAELIRVLESENQNLQNRMTALFNSIDPVEVVLDMTAPLAVSSGIQVPRLPSAPASADLISVTQWLADLRSSVTSLQTIADVLGGCSA